MQDTDASRLRTCLFLQTQKVVVLREGLYFFGHTGPLRLTRGYSHVSIVAFPGEVAILSGGVRLSPAWRPWKCPASVASAGVRGSQDRPGDGGQGQRGRAGGEKGGFGVCWKAQVKQYLPSVETQPDFVFNQLFVLLQPPPPPLPQQPAASPAPEPFESRRGEGKRGGESRPRAASSKARQASRQARPCLEHTFKP